MCIDNELDLILFNSVGEKSKNGQNPFAYDPDFGGQDVTYRIKNDPASYFKIDSNTGELSYDGQLPLDRECQFCNWKDGTYNLTLEACDPERNGFSKGTSYYCG